MSEYDQYASKIVPNAEQQPADDVRHVGGYAIIAAQASPHITEMLRQGRKTGTPAVVGGIESIASFQADISSHPAGSDIVDKMRTARDARAAYFQRCVEYARVMLGRAVVVRLEREVAADMGDTTVADVPLFVSRMPGSYDPDAYQDPDPATSIVANLRPPEHQ